MGLANLKRRAAIVAGDDWRETAVDIATESNDRFEPTPSAIYEHFDEYRTWVNEKDAWSSVAGLTAGQDISERISQQRGLETQFELDKSFAGFSSQGRGW